MLQVHNVRASEETQMHRLTLVVFSLVLPTLMGTGAVVALVAGVTGMWALLGAAGLGAVVAVPLSIGIAKALGP